jgi:hypothetical protein
MPILVAFAVASAASAENGYISQRIGPLHVGHDVMMSLV